MIRRIHLSTGILMVILFLATGQYMEFRTPPVAELDDAARLLYRSAISICSRRAW